MKTVLTTVNEASVTIDGELVGKIGRGFLLLTGFTEGDDEETVRRMTDKILGLRIFPDGNGKTNLSLSDVNGEILSVSQFTLYADASHGRRPSFLYAMRPEKASPLYDYFNQQLSEKYRPVQTGRFGADMMVSSVNSGPFTLVLDSREVLK